MTAFFLLYGKATHDMSILRYNTIPGTVFLTGYFFILKSIQSKFQDKYVANVKVKVENIKLTQLNLILKLEFIMKRPIHLSQVNILTS